MEVLDLGQVSFDRAREVQNNLVKERIAGVLEDVVIFCEHPPTLSLGKRWKRSELFISETEWKHRGVEVVHADRGGAVTYHGPGQLVIYPVVHLPLRGIGVRTFVMFVLEAIADILCGIGISAQACEKSTGVWVRYSCGDSAKIASVGLRIRHGVTVHGFSVNISCDLEPFSHFAPCSMRDAKVTSIAKELLLNGQKPMDIMLDLKSLFLANKIWNVRKVTCSTGTV